MEDVVHLISGAVEDKPDEKAPRRVLSLSRYMPYFVVIGCLLDIFSTFLPWSEDFGLQWFLPFSIALPVGWSVHFIENSFVLAISVAVRIAAVLGLVALSVHVYLKNLLFAIVLLFSIGLSIGSVIVFSQLGWPIYFGSSVVLLGSFSKLVGLVLNSLHVEMTAQGND